MDIPTQPKPRPPQRIVPTETPEETPSSSGTSTEALPKIYFKSPDGEKIIWTNDPQKAENLANAGWTLTQKPPYKPQEHLTEKLRDNDVLQQIRRDLLRSQPEKPNFSPKKGRFISKRRPNQKKQGEKS